MTLKVSPAIAFAPANLVVRATIVADADNRAVQIVAESADFYRSSEIQIQGENAPRTNTFEFRSLPTGTYEVLANLVGADGRVRATVRQQVNIYPSDRQFAGSATGQTVALRVSRSKTMRVPLGDQEGHPRNPLEARADGLLPLHRFARVSFSAREQFPRVTWRRE